MEDLNKRIIEDIQKTAFPSELKLAMTLKENDWTVEQNSTYYDFELDKSRGIDIIASKLFLDETNKLGVSLNLIIEVKKSHRPWVFFSIPYVQEENLSYKGPGFRQIIYTNNFKIDNLPAEKLMQEFPRNSKKFIGISYYEAFKSTKKKSDIFEAILSVIKASFYRRINDFGDSLHKEKNEENYKRPKFLPSMFQMIHIYMPIVVLDGLLYEAVVKSKEDINLYNSSYVPLTTSYSIKPYCKFFEYYPEILDVWYFKDFLIKVENWAYSLL